MTPILMTFGSFTPFKEESLNVLRLVLAIWQSDGNIEGIRAIWLYDINVLITTTPSAELEQTHSVCHICVIGVGVITCQLDSKITLTFHE
mgnify:CR=1 FL=1